MNLSFLNDYNELCSEEILNYVQKHLHTRFEGYEQDVYCKMASKKLCELFEATDAKVQFFIGGTSANLTMLSFMCDHSYDAIFATKYSLIANHEGGAIEGSGHKVVVVKDVDGKIDPKDIEKVYIEHKQDTHMVLPRIVYISNTTEIGTVYSKEELIKISEVCKKYNLYLYIDGLFNSF